MNKIMGIRRILRYDIRSNWKLHFMNFKLAFYNEFINFYKCRNQTLDRNDQTRFIQRIFKFRSIIICRKYRIN